MYCCSSIKTCHARPACTVEKRVFLEKDTYITHIHPLDKPDFITHSLRIQQQQRVPGEANSEANLHGEHKSILTLH